MSLKKPPSLQFSGLQMPLFSETLNTKEQLKETLQDIKAQIEDLKEKKKFIDTMIQNLEDMYNQSIATLNVETSNGVIMED